MSSFPFSDIGSRTRTATAAVTTPATAPNLLTFDYPIGLAAGFDKNGDAIHGMYELGFSFVEIGSVTPLLQGGNEGGSIWRLKDNFGVINRYGFNSSSMDCVRDNLVRYYSRRRRHRRCNCNNEINDEIDDDNNDNISNGNSPTQIVGVNIGKNKITSTGKDAIRDYVTLIRNLGPYSDYMVINVSIPNTPGLRDMQKGVIVRQLLTEQQAL